MRRLPLFLGILMITLNAVSQSPVIPDFPLSFKMSNIKSFTDDQYALFRSKALEAFTANQVPVYDCNLNFFVQPDFVVLSTKTVEGGLKKIELVNAKFLISVFNTFSKQAISAMSVSVQGSGLSKEEAVTNAINAIESDGSNFQNFFKRTNEKMAQYFKSECDEIFNNASGLLAIKEYENLIMMLNEIPPESVECNEKLKPLRSKVIALYMKELEREESAAKNHAKNTQTNKVQKQDSHQKQQNGKSGQQVSNTNSVNNASLTLDIKTFTELTSSSKTGSGNDDPVKSIAAAILAIKQVKK